MTPMNFARNLALVGTVALVGYSGHAQAAWGEPTGGWQLNYDLAVTSDYPTATGWTNSGAASAPAGYVQGDTSANPRANVTQDAVTDERVLSLFNSGNTAPAYRYNTAPGSGTNADLVTVDFRLRLTDPNDTGDQFQIAVTRPGQTSGRAVYLLNFTTSGVNVAQAGFQFIKHDIALGTDWHDFRWHIDVANGSQSLYVNNATVPLFEGAVPFTDTLNLNGYQFGSGSGAVHGAANLSYIRLTNNELAAVPEPVSVGLLAMGSLLLMHRRHSRNV